GQLKARCTPALEWLDGRRRRGQHTATGRRQTQTEKLPPRPGYLHVWADSTSRTALDERRNAVGNLDFENDTPQRLFLAPSSGPAPGASR
ncbi:MAG TPA: hypothetical protein DCE44_08765, partial [Verrucomicrobiales bacterium]|nr:hypothetical protein [Verrucomicrobiales bacterium]